MKPITIEGEQYQYAIQDHVTFFYKNNTQRDISIFESLIYFVYTIKWVRKLPSPKLVFSVDINIENPIYSKEQLFILINDGLKRYNRKIEIDNGDLLPEGRPVLDFSSVFELKCCYCNKTSRDSGIMQFAPMGYMGAVMCYDPRTAPPTLCPENVNRKLPDGTILPIDKN